MAQSSSSSARQFYKKLTAAVFSFRKNSKSDRSDGSVSDTNSSSSDSESPDLMFTYLRWLFKLRWVIIPVVIGLVVAGVFGLINVFKVTNDDFAVPPGTRSYKNSAMRKIWYAPVPSHTTPAPTPTPTPTTKPTKPPTVYRPSETMLIQKLDGSSLLDDDLLYNITRYVYDAWQQPDYLLTSYYAYKENGDLLKAEVLISANHSASMMQVWFATTLTQGVRQVEHEMVQDLYSQFGSDVVYVGFTGTYTNNIEAKTLTEQEVIHSDAIVIPVSFVLLALVVRSWRMIFIPLVSIVVTASYAGGILYLIARYWLKVTSAAPAVIAFLIVALSFDYSLFILTRYREEIQAHGRTPFEALGLSVRHSGHVIMGSGSTLTLCFIGLLFIPIVQFRSLGAGLMIAVILAVTINLTVIPTLILSFPSFFSTFGCFGISRIFKSCSSKIPRPKVPYWFHWAKFTTKWYSTALAVAIIIGLGVPFTIFVTQMETSPDMTLLQPRGMSTAETLERIQDSFSPGLWAPYTIMLGSKQGTIFESPEYWKAAQGFQEDLVGKLLVGQNTSTLASVMLVKLDSVPTVTVPYSMARFANNPLCKLSVCSYFQEGLAATMNPAGTAVTATLVADQAPTSTASEKFVYNLRALVDKYNSQYDDVIEIIENGVSCETYDSNRAVMSSFVITLGIILAICIVVVGFLYQSVLIPLRSVVTIYITLVFSFGFTIGVFQFGWFNGLNCATLSSVVSQGLSWVVVPICFAVVLGLSLDYEIFLLGRITESRKLGYGDKASIEIGVWKTGSVISMAGVIMAVAFLGLVLTSSPMLNQAGFLLVVAVLLDTFVVRPFMTPALMAILGRWNWWPHKTASVLYDDSRHLLDSERGATSDASSADDNSSTASSEV
ncbi:hypothetical protein FOZ60_004786 [Perkinsus olseni]|uniref:Membrane transport protein MMPL domain-containing protein n=1 Tax=Perkinsus olseni TaxID=32597 RepID=A0A7J6NTA8_PEROL|nr:hypothetical protein FOZ60_004786 [Perkinsus olseni]